MRNGPCTLGSLLYSQFMLWDPTLHTNLLLLDMEALDSWWESGERRKRPGAAWCHLAVTQPGVVFLETKGTERQGGPTSFSFTLHCSYCWGWLPLEQSVQSKNTSLFLLLDLSDLAIHGDWPPLQGRSPFKNNKTTVVTIRWPLAFSGTMQNTPHILSLEPTQEPLKT
jgi:hypothetical protein